ncbi:MAG: YceI family protein [Cellvibrionaceae bacterium]
MKVNALHCLLILIVGWGPCLGSAAETMDPLPAGNYTLDRSHASLIFRVDHLGFSMFTARFDQFDAQLAFDPRDMAASTVSATVDARSIETGVPISEELNFNAMLRGGDWLDAESHPRMTFRSRSVEVVSADQVRVHGDFTLRGITQPLTLDVTFNGGYAGHTMDPNARIGFSAQGSLKRSDYGIDFGIPEPGTTMGVSDQVDIIIEAEFTGPAWEAEEKP